MKPNILNISWLKCDNPNCYYKDDSIKVEEYWDYINFPCPKCWESLLTQEDYDTIMKIVSQYNFVDENKRNDPYFVIKWNMNGSGEIDFDLE